MGFDKGIIEVYIMRDEYIVFEQFIYFLRHLFKTRGIGHHFISYAGHGLDKIGDGLSRVYKGFILFNDVCPIKDMYGDLGDPVGGCVGARGFYVDDGIQGESLGLRVEG